ncbi:MAG: restriction endonuclease subunit S [Marinagarivorans sp.]
MATFESLKIAQLVESGEAKLQTGPFGTQLKASDYVDDGIPVINVRNVGFGNIRNKDLEFLDEKMVEKLSAHLLKEGDIVFGRKGAVERHAFIDTEGVGWIQGSDCLRLRIRSDRINNRFISYYLRTQAHQDWMQALCSFGATMASLNQDIVKLITIPVLPIDAQHKIAAVLSAYDDLIENNKRRIALLEKMAEEIYREWFVRFRFPGYQTAEFEKGIPKGWEVHRISTIVDRKKFGRIYRESELNPSGQVVVVDQSREEYLGFYDGPAEHNASIQKPMIIFGDHTCKLVLMHRNFSLAENVIPFLPKNNMAVHFLFHLIKNKAVQTEYKRHWTDLTVQQVLLPPPFIQDLFATKVRPSYELIESLKEQTRILAATKNLLLPRLISGKLSVENLDIQFPPSMQEAN